MWYQRLFGDTRRFAIQFELHEDPHPVSGLDPLLQRSWGRVCLWVRDRCLTRCVISESTVHDGVTWYTLPFVSWLRRSAVALVNEEPLPAPVRREEIHTAAEWFDESEEPSLTLLADEEDTYYEERSDWWQRHAVRAGFEGAVVPNLFLRRLGDDVEVSWDNQSRPSTRPDLAYLEPAGSERVPASDAAAVIQDAAEGVARELSLRLGGELPAIGAPARPGADGWRWLVPRATADVIESAACFASLLAKLERHSESAPGLLVAHTLETLLLRDVVGRQASSLEQLLGVLDEPTGGTWGATLEAQRRPCPPPFRRPWLAGYDAARDFREAVGWGEAPAPRLDAWLGAEGVGLSEHRLIPFVDGMALVTGGGTHPAAHVNPAGRRQTSWSRQMMLATALGHLLLDAPRDRDFAVVQTPWTHWPSAARARAFGAMLLMPEDAIRRRLRGRSQIDRETVGSLMKEFQTGRTATTWHLQNLGLLSPDERLELVTAGD